MSGNLAAENTLRHEKKVRWSVIITLIMFTVQLVGGILTNSLAITSDAWHLSSDLLALSLSWYAIRQTMKPANEKHTFGYHRFGSLAALINGLTLIGISLFIGYQSILRFIHPSGVHSTGMIALASVGFIATLLIAVILKDGKENINVKSAFLHFVGDVLSYFGILVGGIILYFTGWNWIDPLLSAFFALIILKNAWQITKEAAVILLEAVPENISVKVIKERLLAEPEIEKILDLHVWGLSNEHFSLSTHLKVQNMELRESITLTEKIEQILYKEYGIAHTTIQFHTENEGLRTSLGTRIPNIH